MTGSQRLPARLGRYQITRVLGQGAMGVVYEGMDPALNRRVAIKTILHSALADAGTLTDASARFVREAQAVARLNHPHIVTVFDFGDEGDLSYLVMEFVQGRELKACFDQGVRFTATEAVRIVRELLDALEFAHRQGVIHRDVKPANVMLDDEGRVKLTDFGVARLIDGSTDRTVAGTMVGTPSHMSPEQIQGLPVGSRTDIFAAGIVLYECLTGARPFGGSGVWAVQKQIIHDDPPPPSVRRPELGTGFDAIIIRALAKDPENRFASAAEFSRALATLQTMAAVPGSGITATLPAFGPGEAEEATIVLTPSQDKRGQGGVGITAATLQASVADPPVRGMAPRMPHSIASDTPSPPVPTQAPAVSRFTRPWWVAILAVAVVLAAGLLWWGGRSGMAPASPPLQSPPVHLPAAELPARPLAAPTPLPPDTAVGERGSATLPPTPAPPAPLEAEAPVSKPPAPKAPAAPVVKPMGPAQVPRPAPRREAAAPESRSVSPARCEALMQRVQLGESLSPELLAVLRKECQK
ncbi:MAG: protein kinase [Zoogloeaceae bacterium]|nr:protein kinase [Zoogloeaceae bacterium]